MHISIVTKVLPCSTEPKIKSTFCPSEPGKIKTFTLTNSDSTWAVVFCNNVLKNQVQKRFEGINIENVCEVKFLGVVFDDKSCWTSQINAKLSNYFRHIQSKTLSQLLVIPLPLLPTNMTIFTLLQRFMATAALVLYSHCLFGRKDPSEQFTTFKSKLL